MNNRWAWKSLSTAMTRKAYQLTRHASVHFALGAMRPPYHHHHQELFTASLVRSALTHLDVFHITNNSQSAQHSHLVRWIFWIKYGCGLSRGTVDSSDAARIHLPICIGRHSGLSHVLWQRAHISGINGCNVSSLRGAGLSFLPRWLFGHCVVVGPAQFRHADSPYRRAYIDEAVWLCVHGLTARK